MSEQTGSGVMRNPRLRNTAMAPSYPGFSMATPSRMGSNKSSRLPSAACVPACKTTCSGSQFTPRVAWMRRAISARSSISPSPSPYAFALLSTEKKRIARELAPRDFGEASARAIAVGEVELNGGCVRSTVCGRRQACELRAARGCMSGGVSAAEPLFGERRAYSSYGCG